MRNIIDSDNNFHCGAIGVYSMNDVSIAYRNFWGIHPSPVVFRDPFGIPGNQGRPPGEVRMLIAGTASDLPGNITTTYPRMIVPIIEPSPGRNNVANIIIWDRHPVTPGFTPTIYEIVRQLKERIPLDGAELILPNGALQIWRGDTFFAGFMSDPNDRLAIGGICNIVVRGNNYD